MYKPPGLYDNEGPTYLGPAHRPFVPKAEGLANLRLAKGISLERLDDRKQLLRTFDDISREIDASGDMSGIDAYTQRALEMIASPKVREAFDLKKEPPGTARTLRQVLRELPHGPPAGGSRRLGRDAEVGDWDTHEKNFIDHKAQLPQLDKGFHALVSDLYDRGLEKDVAVVMWGEFGRCPEDHARRRPRPLARGRCCGRRRRRLQGRAGDRRNRRPRRPRRRARRTRPATCSRRSTATWASTPRHDPRPREAADVRPRRPRTGPRTGIGVTRAAARFSIAFTFELSRRPSVPAAIHFTGRAIMKTRTGFVAVCALALLTCSSPRKREVEQCRAEAEAGERRPRRQRPMSIRRKRKSTPSRRRRKMPKPRRRRRKPMPRPPDSEPID